MSTPEPIEIDGPVRLQSCTVDPIRRVVTWDDGRQMRLTGHEAGAFLYLAERPNITVEREDLLEHVWGYKRDLATRAVDNAIARLRAKIEADTRNPKHLMTFRGKGYSLVLPEAEPAGALTPLDELSPGVLSPLRSHMGGASAPEGEVAIGTAVVHQAQARWDATPEAMAQASEDVDRILRGALKVIEGYEVKSDTSGFMAAFPSAAAAVAWAVGAQQGLAAHTWPGGLSLWDGGSPGLMICVGLDLGAPLYRRDPVTGRMEYFGPMVNRAAQLARQARAGEVLATRELADGVGSQGPLGWVGMGARELVPGSGVANAVSRLVHSALPVQESIADDSTRAHRTNLPSPDRAFTGRSTELAELNRLFNDQARWTTVVGTAGVGKSRLVQEAARRWLSSCPGGVWWCELAAVHDLDGLLGVVAQTLDLNIGGGADQAGAELGKALAGLGKAVLILDNLEALVPSCRVLLEGWLAEAPALQLVATSQVAVQAELEQQLQLAPMDTEQAVHLLEIRAREAHRGFVLDAQTRPIAEQIAQTLDGIPLAIELAGARMHMLGPEALLERLSDRFKLLRGRRGRSSGRHSTLWDAIDWSWGLLEPAEQAALAQCSVFDGGFDMAAAESVIGLPDSAEDWTALDALQGLRDHSLIQLGESPLAPGTPRFKLLSSVRAFAQAELAELDPDAEAALRHRAYFTEVILPLAKQVGRSDATGSLAGLELELPNLLVAFGHALAADPDAAVDLISGIRTVFFLRGPRHRTAALLDQVPMASLTEKKRATCLVFRGLGLMDASDWTAAASVLAEARAAAEASGEPGIQGYVRTRCGDLARHQGDIETAESHYLATIDLAHSVGDWQSEVRAMRRVGMLARARGDAAAAAARYREAIALSGTHGGTLLSASIENYLGLVLMDMGDLDGARDQFEHSRSVALTLGGAGLVASALANLGVLHIERGEPEQALAQLREARELAESIGHKLVLAQIEAAIVQAQTALA